MPTYEYKCQNCGHTFEKFQNMKDKSLENCPECDGKVRRIISGGAGIIFKGSGSYATDHHSNSNPECGREQSCCGRETTCDKKPCE